LATIRESASRVPDLSQGWVRRFELEELLLEGDWDEAERLARASLEMVAPGLHQRARLGLAMLSRLRGEPGDAWSSVLAGLPSGPAAAPGQHIVQNAIALLRLGAELALDDGDLQAAASWLAGFDRWLVWTGTVRWRADGRLLWARYHRLAGDADMARTLAIEAESEASSPHQPLVLLAAHRFLGELATSAADWAVAESYLLESLSLASACAAPYERALSCQGLAELRAAEGRAGEAEALLAEVREIGQRLGARPLLARADSLAAKLLPQPAKVAGGSRLSAREIEVLQLVAAGRSNLEIAEALFVSPRTVTTHLTHIFDKLDVEGRAEAVALALRQGVI
jgi:DNA-binding CsgD family transcriptional regulator